MKSEIQLSPQFVDRVARWAKGEITWAQVEGFTARQARELARVACDLAERGQHKKAAVIFEGLVALNPNDHGNRAALGTVYQKMGHVADAAREYEASIAGDPRNVVALANRGELRLMSGDKGGLEDLRLAVEADPGLGTASAKRAKAVAEAFVTRAAAAGGACR